MQPTPPHITIRKATGDDVEHVAAIFAAAFAPLRSIYRPTDEVVARQTEHAKEGTRLVAEVEEQVVATVQFDRHKEHVHVIGLAVHPDFQRMGIARRMIGDTGTNPWSQPRRVRHNQGNRKRSVLRKTRISRFL